MSLSKKATGNLRESDRGYEEFLRGLDLIAIGLKSCSAQLNRAGMAELSTERRRSLRSFVDAYKVTEFGPNFFEASGLFVLTVRESPESKPVLLVECEFEAHLHGREPLSRAFVDRFVESEFQLILIPYARQFVSSTTAQMSIPPVVIPLSTGHSSKDSSARSKRTSKTHAKAR